MDYDAFISYSHAARGRHASAVHAELQRLRPERRRPARIFRDVTGLAFDPYMYATWSQRVRTRAEWRMLYAAMAGSKWFILLASEEAAQSVAVNREVRYWLETKSISRLVVITTQAGHRSNPAGVRVARTALPPALRDRVHELTSIVAVDANVDGRTTRRKLRRSLRPIAAAIFDETPESIARLHPTLVPGQLSTWPTGWVRRATPPMRTRASHDLSR